MDVVHGGCLGRMQKRPQMGNGTFSLGERMCRFDLRVFPRHCLGLRPKAGLLILLSLLFAGCGKKEPSIPQTDLKRLADRYYNALETADVEEYVRLFHPAIRDQMADSLKRIAALEITDWMELKAKHRWQYATEERELDAEVYPMCSDAPTSDLARFLAPDAKLWEVRLCYRHGFRLRASRNHLLAQSSEGLYLFLPPDMEARVHQCLGAMRAFCAERQRDIDSFRNAMQAVISAPTPEHLVEMRHIRYPLYIEGTRAKDSSCLVSLGASQAAACPTVSIGIEIIAYTSLVVKPLLLTSCLGEDERLESSGAFGIRMGDLGVDPVLKCLDEGVTRDDQRYTPWVFTKELSREPPGVVLLRAPVPNESRDAAEQAFLGCLDAFERGLAVHSVVKYRVDSQRVGFYVDQDGKNVGGAFAVDVHAEIVDVNDPAVRRKASFSGFPPSMIGIRHRSGFDKAFDAFRDWLISMD